MQYISRILVIAALAIVAHTATAQPPARNRDNAEKNSKAKKTAVIEQTERAKSQYPAIQTPQEVDWKRDVYRVLDLEKEKNAPLYYPVEPTSGCTSLFTFLFHNIINGNITAYRYNRDGLEKFTEENILEPLELLENNRIYYEEKDGEFIVGNSDVPSAEVLSYYIKESHYYDQRTGTYGTRVTAICPVLHRSRGYAGEQPMFWVNYDDVAPMLAQQPIMSSSLNNVTSTTINDYFAKGLYDGEIYRTVNMRNLTLSQYCKDSVSLKKEQEKIEQQLADFETNLWNTKTVAEIRRDSIAAAIAAANDTINSNDSSEKKAPAKEPVKRTSTKSKKKESTEPKAKKAKSKSSNSGSSGSGRVSVRRERR